MKSLKLLIISTSIILIILILTSYHQNPYYGKYSSKINNNITLDLHEDNKFTMTNTFNKGAEHAYGKYTVNDNNITLIPNKDNYCFFNDQSIKGKVEGSKIIFSNFLTTEHCEFNKH